MDSRKGLRTDWAGRPFENPWGLETPYHTSDTVERTMGDTEGKSCEVWVENNEWYQ